jgi:hypothetical protein
LRSRGRALGVLALLGTLLAPSVARGFDLKVWPLFRVATNEARGELRWSALGPLVEYTRTPEWTDLRIRPLFWLRRERDDTRAELLFPLASVRRQPGYESVRFLLLSQRTSTHDATGSFTLFPFVFYRADAEHGAHGGVLPFYLDLEDFLGYERVQTVLFPAYLRLVEPRVERRFYLFPFVSTVGGADGSGFRIWPFYGTKTIAGRERSGYVLWPFYIHSERLDDTYGWESRRVWFPVLSTLDGPHRHSRGWGMMGHTHTVDELQGYEATGAPWPAVFRERRLGEETWRVWRLTPFYGYSDRDGIRSRFVAWPFFRSTDQDADDFHFRRRDAILILWRRQWQWNEATGARSSLFTLFPLIRSASDDGRPSGQVPALFDSIIPTNRGVLAMWAPLWGLFRWDASPEGDLDWNLLWGLVARERGTLRGPIDVH